MTPHRRAASEECVSSFGEDIGRMVLESAWRDRSGIDGSKERSGWPFKGLEDEDMGLSLGEDEDDLNVGEEGEEAEGDDADDWSGSDCFGAFRPRPFTCIQMSHIQTPRRNSSRAHPVLQKSRYLGAGRRWREWGQRLP
jgi:hypothetical protein